ncbi:hypothetical protein HALG_00026 [Halorubrum virus CGphi46]|uniref:Uncharacterized protein n=1 Tax=Halorubrum virus CGphi46 TaxID=754066 RepID=R9TQN5_9CAUD|nr:hypothetical protein HALG_00026 [Halorubrum virus CGphi46]AGN33814.1 hypothetical protein HALG_00026 [Halorubrum virus CGphi46]
MAIEYPEDASGRSEPVATGCPYCGEPLDEGIGMAEHLPCDDVPPTEEVFDA